MAIVVAARRRLAGEGRSRRGPGAPGQGFGPRVAAPSQRAEQACRWRSAVALVGRACRPGGAGTRLRTEASGGVEVGRRGLRNRGRPWRGLRCRGGRGVGVGARAATRRRRRASEGGQAAATWRAWRGGPGARRWWAPTRSSISSPRSRPLRAVAAAGMVVSGGGDPGRAGGAWSGSAGPKGTPRDQAWRASGAARFGLPGQRSARQAGGDVEPPGRGGEPRCRKARASSPARESADQASLFEVEHGEPSGDQRRLQTPVDSEPTIGRGEELRPRRDGRSRSAQTDGRTSRLSRGSSDSGVSCRRAE